MYILPSLVQIEPSTQRIGKRLTNDVRGGHLRDIYNLIINRGYVNETCAGMKTTHSSKYTLRNLVSYN